MWHKSDQPWCPIVAGIEVKVNTSVTWAQVLSLSRPYNVFEEEEPVEKKRGLKPD